jgi:hypothetical protein
MVGLPGMVVAGVEAEMWAVAQLCEESTLALVNSATTMIDVIVVVSAAYEGDDQQRQFARRKPSVCSPVIIQLVPQQHRDQAGEETLRES